MKKNNNKNNAIQLRCDDRKLELRIGKLANYIQRENDWIHSILCNVEYWYEEKVNWFRMIRCS